MKNNLNSFTLLELIVVVIIVGILAAIAIPIYNNVLEQRRGETAINNLRMILVAEQIHQMKYEHFWPNDGLEHNNIPISEINHNLNIDISDSNFDYSIHNAYFNDEINPIYLRARRNNGRYVNQYILLMYLPHNEESLWRGPWFHTPPNPPSFPLPED